GFQKVVIELVDPASGMLAPRASVGWPRGAEPTWQVPAEEILLLLDPAFELGVHGGGRGPRAWDRHRLHVPLRDASGAVVGRIWADEPEDLLLPSRARLEALALFAGQATLAM